MFIDMTSNEITDRLILDNQNLVVEELMKHDESLLDSLQNFDENSEVLEWWLVTPYMAELLKEKGEVILSDYDCYWWGRTTSGQALYMGTRKGFQLDLEIELEVSLLIKRLFIRKIAIF